MDGTNAGCSKRTRQHGGRCGKCIPRKGHGGNGRRHGRYIFQTEDIIIGFIGGSVSNMR